LKKRDIKYNIINKFLKIIKKKKKKINYFFFSFFFFFIFLLIININIFLSNKINDFVIQQEISISQLNFINNTNLNKYECGSIHFCNDLNIFVKNSTFDNNYCKNNGGAM